MESNSPKSNRPSDAIVTFDTVYTTNSIQLLKLALPLFCTDLQPLLAAIIKAKELTYCYQLSMHTSIHSISIRTNQFETFLKEAKCYLSEEQLSMFQTFEQIRKAMSLLEKIQILNQDMPFADASDLSNLLLLMPQMSEFGSQQKEASSSKDDTNNSDTQPDQMSQILSNTLSQSQKEVYDKYFKKFSEK